MMWFRGKTTKIVHKALLLLWCCRCKSWFPTREVSIYLFAPDTAADAETAFATDVVKAVR